jgi:hypothetical protein
LVVQHQKVSRNCQSRLVVQHQRKIKRINRKSTYKEDTFV